MVLSIVRTYNDNVDITYGSVDDFDDYITVTYKNGDIMDIYNDGEIIWFEKQSLARRCLPTLLDIDAS